MNVSKYIISNLGTDKYKPLQACIFPLKATYLLVRRMDVLIECLVSQTFIATLEPSRNCSSSLLQNKSTPMRNQQDYERVNYLKFP